MVSFFYIQFTEAFVRCYFLRFLIDVGHEFFCPDLAGFKRAPECAGSGQVEITIFRNFRLCCWICESYRLTGVVGE